MHCSEISRSYFITVHVDEITVLFLLEKNKTGKSFDLKKMNAYDDYSILSSNYGFRTKKKNVYPSFQHKTDYPYATFDKMVCPSYT